MPKSNCSPCGEVDDTHEGLLVYLMMEDFKVLLLISSEFFLHSINDYSFAMSINLAFDCFLVSYIDI